MTATSSGRARALGLRRRAPARRGRERGGRSRCWWAPPRTARGASPRAPSGSPGVTLLDGRISLSGIHMSARATAAPGGAEAGLTEASVEGLTVDGRAVAAGPGSRVEVAGHRHPGPARERRRRRRRAARQRPAGRGHRPAGRVHHRPAVRDRPPRPVGHRRAPGAGAGARRAGTTPRPAEPAPAPAARRAQPGRSTPASPTGRPRRRWPRPPPLGLPRRPAPEVALPAGRRATSSRCSATSSFIDDYGAPRAVTGWHHGNDIFAPTGTPAAGGRRRHAVAGRHQHASAATASG